MSTMDRVLVAAGVAWTLAVMAGCRRDAPLADIGTACDRKLLTTADVAPLLSEPVTGAESIPGDRQSCRFKTAGYASVTVALRPRLGRTTLATWKSGRMPLTATPLPGVGDEAVWVDDLSEVVAEKNDVLCDIQLTGLTVAFNRQPAEARQKAIGTLCNKILSEVK
jgi:hypothetical protein